MKREIAARGRRLSIVKLSKVPRKGEYTIELSDGYRFRVTAEQLSRFGLDAGREIDPDEVPVLERGYEAAVARKAAVRLLKVRPRASGELRRELVRRRHRAEAIGAVLADLEETGALDDRLFARLWIKERVEKKGYGKRRIASELLTKGVSREIVEDELRVGFDRESELAVAGRAARARLRRLGSVPLETRKRRIYTYLLRSGFTSDIAGEATKSVLEPYIGEECNDNG
jgi:regulatory protein